MICGKNQLKINFKQTNKEKNSRTKSISINILCTSIIDSQSIVFKKKIGMKISKKIKRLFMDQIIVFGDQIGSDRIESNGTETEMKMKSFFISLHTDEYFFVFLLKINGN